MALTGSTVALRGSEWLDSGVQWLGVARHVFFENVTSFFEGVLMRPSTQPLSHPSLLFFKKYVWRNTHAKRIYQLSERNVPLIDNFLSTDFNSRVKLT